MIQKMKKLTFLVTDKEYDDFIVSIRELGVVHVTQLQEGVTSPELQESISLEASFRQALDYIAVVGKQNPLDVTTPIPTISQPLELLRRVETLRVQENDLLHHVDELYTELSKLMPWGDFDPTSLSTLSDKIGMEIRMYSCRSKSFKKEWEDKYFATIVGEDNKKVFFLTFSTEDVEIPAERIVLPEKSLTQVQLGVTAAKRQLTDVRQELSAIDTHLRHILERGEKQTMGDISLAKVHLSSERTCGNVLRLMLGWVREDATASLQQYLDKAHIFYEMEDPAFEDDVPVLIKNGRFSKLFEPILKMYSLPNYNDLDPTTFFAPFFMLFFGLCMGDAGYGILITLIGIFLAYSKDAEKKAYGRLAFFLGVSTIVCGLATGTLFGIDLSKQPWTWVEYIKPYLLTDSGVGPIFGYSPMMVISVFIGLVQVILGMVLKGLKAMKNYGWPYAVGTLSWVVALVSATTLFGLPFCGIDLPTAAQYTLTALLLISCIGIFLYNNPASYKRPALGLLSNIGGGVWATYGMATGLLGDLLSYIRLFALGLTGGILGGVFNTLALDMTASIDITMFRILSMVLILLLGHGITFALSMISAFVHPMRLTFVEFFKNADFSGGGKAYDPFRNVEQ